MGRIYQQTFIDIYTRVAVCKLYDRKHALTTADTLNDRVLPFFEAEGIPLLRVLTDRGSEYVGNLEGCVAKIIFERSESQATLTQAAIRKSEATNFA